MTNPLTPPPMTDDEITAIRNGITWCTDKGKTGVNSLRLSRAVIAARDAQWLALVGELQMTERNRLDWMIFHSASVRHSNDAEFCWVEWADREEGIQQTGNYTNARDAIDAARGEKGGV